MSHSEQAIWYLNGFWEAGASKDAETVWKLTHSLIEIETGHPVLYGKRKQEVKEGSDVDEMKAHVFLEKLGETLTVRALRKKLTDLGIADNKKMALAEYLTTKYNKTPEEFAFSPQGEGVSAAELKAAQDQLDRLNEQFAKTSAALEAQTKALEELQRAEAELKIAVEAVHAEERKRAEKIAALQETIHSAASGMRKAKASNELQQIQSEDPLPLRKAKITQEAALKRTERAQKTCAAEKAKLELEVAETEKQVKAAEKVLHELQSRKGSPLGKLWWMERQMREAQKFMPKK